jgi:hypothetical protein
MRMRTHFSTRAHKSMLDQTKQNEQYLIRQTQLNSNEWYISLGTIIIHVLTSTVTLDDSCIVHSDDDTKFTVNEGLIVYCIE